MTTTSLTHMPRLLTQTLYCPFPAAINPHRDVVTRHLVEWGQRWELLTPTTAQQLLAAHLDEFVARLYPHATRDVLQLAACWFTWLFVHDDQADETSEDVRPHHMVALHTRCRALLAGAPPRAADVPLSAALADLLRQFRQQATPRQVQAFTDAMQRYVTAVEQETAQRALGATFNVATYLQVRRDSSGVYPSLPLTELSQPSPLPSAVRRHPALHRLHALVNNIIAWCNDLYSLPKEQHQSPPSNLVLLLGAEQGLALPAAFERVVALHNAEVTRLLAWEAHLQALGLADETLLTQYCTGLHHCIRGHLDWSCTTSRYQAATLVRAA
ncbi:MAG: hypothetical protein FJZ47_13630 [Candidatus Tectomicrobia bacterium]|uniref:Terpene synthase n=1 Tax=Tectimicrobiota bacterium TaxID=2528274 RepID=A0A937W3Q3_UNCTE|nr:hypothetical protein [Candidatus Tectomicrobia bacterium]